MFSSSKCKYSGRRYFTEHQRLQYFEAIDKSNIAMTNLLYT